MGALSTFSLAICLLLLSHIVVSYASAYSNENLEPQTDGYGRKIQNQDYGQNYANKGKTSPYIIGVQGLIYCKVGSDLIPLKGALARITCLTVDKDGYESAPFSILSKPTDVKGYFSGEVSPYGSQSYNNPISKCNCKAFLEKSPKESCNVATNINNGTSGVPLSNHYRLIKKNVRLYSVGSFVYVPKSSSVSEKY